MYKLWLLAIVPLFLFCDQKPLEPNEIPEKVEAASTTNVTTFSKKFCNNLIMLPHSLTKTFDSGYALFGNLYDEQIYLLKTDGSGNFLWEKSFYGNEGYYVRETPDHGLILTGRCYYGEPDSTIFIKVDSLGNVQWRTSIQNFPVHFNVSIAPSHDNGFVGTGYARRITVFKLNSEGSVLWVKQYGDTLRAEGNSILRTSDNGFIIAGKKYTQVFGRNSNIFLMKIDAQGELQWLKTYGGPYEDEGNAVIQTRDDGFVVAGYVTLDTTTKHSETYLVKTDADGNTKWRKGYFPCNGGKGADICETSDGSFAICGHAYSKACIIKVSSNGSYKWTKSYKDTVLSAAAGIEATSDGGFAIFGSANADDYWGCFALVKTDSNGNY